jgi:hypoxanthine phosphoribosyltransferase
MKNINKIYIKNFLVDVIVFFFRGLLTIAILIALYLAITELMNYQVKTEILNQTTK